MIAGSAFDLYKPLFTAAKVAVLCGVKRPVIDTMGTRGFIQASGREQAAAPRQSAKTKGRRPSRPKGRPLFSARDIFKVRLMRVLADEVDFALTESKGLAEKSEETGEAEGRKISDYEASLSALADKPAYGGEWMWAMARSIERGKPFLVYAYVARLNGRWQFDMHMEIAGGERPTEQPCFGWNVSHIYVPVGEIFTALYNDCKKLLGVTMGEAV